MRTDRHIRVEELLRAEQDLEVLQLAKNFAKDNDQNEWVDDDVVLHSCARVRLKPERTDVNCFIAYEGNKAIGFFVGVIYAPFHRKGLVASQVFCYVDSIARGSLAVKRMHTAFDNWAKLSGATSAQTSTTNTRYAERASKIFDKLGYKRVGYTHLKEF